MARAHASAVIDAPVEAVWAVVRNFNSLPDWHPAIERGEIEGGNHPTGSAASAASTWRAAHMSGSDCCHWTTLRIA